MIGAVSLRTRGVYFIMITLAFAQMLFYLTNSVKAYGGDEGLSLLQRSDFGLGLDLQDDTTFYYLVLVVLALVILLVHRLVHSRFGRVVQAMREDDVRAEAIGFPTYRYQLILFVIGGALGGLAGALMANQQNYISPNLLHWTQSGHADGDGHHRRCRHALRRRAGRAGAAGAGGGGGRLHHPLAVLCRLDPACRRAVRAARTDGAAPVGRRQAQGAEAGPQRGSCRR